MKSILESINESYRKVGQIIDKCLANGDGIYAWFQDHLNCDANSVIVVKNHKLVPINIKVGKFKLESGPNDILELLMDSDSDYYGTIGFTHGMKVLKEHFGLKTYYCSIGYNTFSRRWEKVKKDDYYAKKCDEFFDIYYKIPE